ncbi:MAG: hypothetical protein K0S30_1695 [Clostridia bacterium]|nr:hypothetical protein [Clostridia bacterium]
MGVIKNNYAVNQVDKDSVIYDTGEQIDSISLIIKGRVLAKNNGSKTILGSGNFIGVSDLNMGRYQSSYIAYDDVLFYCFPVSNNEELAEVFATNKDYKGLMVASLTRHVSELEKTYQALLQTAEQLFHFVDSYNYKYLDMGKRLGYTVNVIPSTLDLHPFSNDFILDERKLEFYKESAKIQVDIWKSFCSQGDMISFYFVEEMQELINQLIEGCEGLTTYILELSQCLMSSNNDCLYKNYAALAINIEESGGYNSELIDDIDAIIDRINGLEKLYDEKLGIQLSIDRSKMEEIYYLLLSKKSGRKEQVNNNFLYSENEVNEVLSKLADSFNQIHDFAGQTHEKKEELRKYIMDYMNLKDKRGIEDASRALRRKIMNLFYELYEYVFFKAMETSDLPKVVDLFLCYGFLDEKLLSKEQLKELYYLDKVKDDYQGLCRVYNIKEWLTCIYRGEKEPSKNEFDLEFADYLRENRKKGQITEKEEKELLANTVIKTKHEIQNMFRYNHRLVSGQLSSFVPFLYGDSFIKNIRDVVLTKKRLDDAVKAILDIDYSLFHRDIMYVNPEKGIAKEYVMTQVPPDLLLFPTVGYNGVMWQEVSGKKKSNPGRIFLPIFTEVDIKDILIKVFGRYRWELCRTIQGNAWNNIKEKSLTSEYADYIQFYRKNRDLSEEVKEKLKIQIQKGKGNYREIFSIDYEIWVKGESAGGMRLNRVSREILATYCPFSKPIREKVKNMPLIAEAMTRFYRNKAKTLKELDIRNRVIEKEGGQLTEELMDNYIFYRDL